MDTPSNEPGPLHLAPAAGDGVLPPVVPDSVPVLTTLPGSAPLSLILGGFLALLLSAWAGIVPFIGPSFGFSPDGTASWTWNLVHGLGAAVPGGTMDPDAHAPHRRLGRHLPRHDVFHHGAGCPRLCAGPPGSRGSHPPLRIPAD